MSTTTNPTAPDFSTLAPAFAGRFALIIAGLVAVVARGLLRDPKLAPHIVPLWRRLTGAARRITALMTNLAAGKPAAKRRGKGNGRDAPEPRERSPNLPIPTTKAWLVIALKHEAAVYGSQLRHLLSEPGVAELLDAAPAARRLLNPICHMLGLPRREAKRSGDESDRCAPSRTESALSNVAPHPPPNPTPPARAWGAAPCEHLALRFPWNAFPRKKTT